MASDHFDNFVLVAAAGDVNDLVAALGMLDVGKAIDSMQVRWDWSCPTYYASSRGTAGGVWMR